MQHQRNLRFAACTASLAIVVAVGMLAATARSADDQKKDTAGAVQAGQKMSPEQMKAMMAKMAEAATPGPEHQRLKDMEGTWTAEGQFFNPDGSPGGKTTGVMTCKMVLGGRYLHMSFDGKADMGQGPMPFHGAGTQGYDKVLKKYVSTWMDDWSTGIMTSRGTADGSTLTLEGTASCPMAGGECPTREVSTMSDKDHMKMEMWMAEGNGAPLTKCMEINYTRKN